MQNLKLKIEERRRVRREQDNLELIPAVLASDLDEFRRLIRVAEEFVDYVQIDLMDGKFVPSKSISAEELKSISTSLRAEAHLMVENPRSYLPALKEFGTEKAIFHYEATSDPEGLIKEFENSGLAVGIAINPETPVSVLGGLFDLLDFVLFLTVHPGSYGHEFLPEVLEKVKELRAANQTIKIGVDGGIKLENIEQVSRSGADLVYVGSAIFLQEDPRKSYFELRHKVEQVSQNCGAEDD